MEIIRRSAGRIVRLVYTRLQGKVFVRKLVGDIAVWGKVHVGEIPWVLGQAGVLC